MGDNGGTLSIVFQQRPRIHTTTTPTAHTGPTSTTTAAPSVDETVGRPALLLLVRNLDFAGPLPLRHAQQVNTATSVERPTVVGGGGGGGGGGVSGGRVGECAVQYSAWRACAVAVHVPVVDTTTIGTTGVEPATIGATAVASHSSSSSSSVE